MRSERIALILLAGFLAIAILPRSQLTAAKPSATKRLEDCFRMADYLRKAKVVSCKKTAELGASASISFHLFSSCIEQMDSMITMNRDTCQREYLQTN